MARRVKVDGGLIDRIVTLRREGQAQTAIAVELGVTQGKVSQVLRLRGLGGRLDKADEERSAFDELYAEWARASLSVRLLRQKMIKMGEKRYLGYARVKTEGEPLVFDEGNPITGNYVPRGAGDTMREEDAFQALSALAARPVGPCWYVVRDRWCSSDIDDEEAAVWTLSRSLDETGWETDGGFSGYGLKYADARELADGANRGV